VCCAGVFQAYNNTARYNFVRLTSTGSLIVCRNRFDTTTTGIANGGKNMFDNGLSFNTNLTQLYGDIDNDNVDVSLSIPSTHVQAYTSDPYDRDGVFLYEPDDTSLVKSGDDYFGSDSEYFTNMYEGMFVLVANNININQFSITGALGSGHQNVLVNKFKIYIGSDTYTVFTKYVDSSSSPSVNHFIILPGDNLPISHFYDNTGQYDDDCIQGSMPSELFFFCVGLENGDRISDPDALNLAKKFLVTALGVTYETYDIRLKSQNGSTEDSDGNLDTAVVDGISLQRTAYIEFSNPTTGRIVVEAIDGERITTRPLALEEYFPVIKTS
jgi:hypothetical protein